MTFSTIEGGWSSGLSSVRDPSTNISNDQYDAQNFLSRPVLIYTRDWEPQEGFFDVLDPWSIVCEDERILPRLTNFMNLRTDMEINIVINGGPFYSGRLIVSYLPMGGDDIVFSDTGVNPFSLINLHQMEHVMCDPTLSEGGKLTLPFLHPNHSVLIPNKGWNRLGRLYVAPFNTLRHSNDGMSPVSISIFAMLKNPKMHCTTEVEPQSDEYGIISGPANIIGKIAGSLTDVPGIGMYAKATQMVAKVGVAVAKMFGFSRPRVLTDLFSHDLSCTDTPFSGGALSFTAKKEACISPTIMGASDEDQLALAYHTRKWNYLTQFEWSSSSGTSAMLFNIGVNPLQGILDENGVLQFTNQGWISNLFQSWHGSMEIMLQPVVSSHHRGRLVVVHDPIRVSDTVRSFESFNVANRAVIDLSNKASTVFKIGWVQDGNYLPVVSKTATTWDEVLPAFTAFPQPPRDSDNGQFAVFVLNQLTTPSEFLQEVTVNVYFRMCEDFSLQDPTQERISSLAVLNESRGEEQPIPDFSGISTPEFIRAGTDLLTTPVTTFVDQTVSAEEGLTNLVTWRTGVGVNASIRGVLIDDGIEEVTTTLPAFYLPYAYVGRPVSLTFRATGAGNTDINWNASFTKPFPAFADATVTQTVTLNGIGDEAVITFTPATPFIAMSFTGSSRPLIRDITYSLPTGTEIIVSTAADLNGISANIAGAQGDDLIEPVDLPAQVSGTQSLALGFRTASMANDAVADGNSSSVTTYEEGLFFTKISYLRDNAVPQSADHDEPVEDDPEPSTPDIELEQGWTPDDSDLFFGEKILSLRTMLKRFTTSYIATFTEFRMKQMTLPHYPRAEMLNQFTVPMTLYSYLERGFLGVRGSTRINIIPSDIPANVVPHMWFSKRLPTSLTTLTPTAVSRNGIDMVSTLDGSHASCAHVLGAYNLELPYYDRVRFLPTRTSTIAWRDFDGQSNFYNVYLNSPGPLECTINYATGEDFAFFNFVTVPRFQAGAVVRLPI